MNSNPLENENIAKQLKALEQIQSIDLKLDVLKKDHVLLPHYLKKLKDQLQGLQAIITLQKEKKQEHMKLAEQAKFAFEMNEERTVRATQKLGAVRNSSEYQAANKELEQLKKQKVALEQQQASTLTEIQKLDEEIKKVQADFEGAHQKLEALKTESESKSQKLTQDIQVLDDQRKNLVSVLSPRILKLYERVRAQRAGVGITPTLQGRCKACNMVVPPQLFNEVFKAIAVHACPSCSRILFIPAEQSELTVHDSAAS